MGAKTKLAACQQTQQQQHERTIKGRTGGRARLKVQLNDPKTQK